MAYPAGTWMLLNGHAVPFTSWQKTNPLELQLYTPPLVGLATSAWAGPSEADVFGLPVGQTATVTLVDEVGTVVATQTIDGNGALQTVAFPAELLNRRTVGQRTRSVIISATVTVSARIIDWRLFYQTQQMVPGTLPGGYTRRDSDDRQYGWDAAYSLPLLNYTAPAAGFPILVAPPVGLGPAWSAIPDSAAAPFWTDANTLHYYTLPCHAVGPTVDFIQGPFSSGGPGSPVTTPTYTLNGNPVTLPEGGTLTMDPTLGVNSLQLFTSGPGAIVPLYGDVSNIHIVDLSSVPGFVNKVIYLQRSPKIPPIFSWPDTGGGYHAGGYDPARVRAPLATTGKYFTAPAGALTVTIPTLALVTFTPNSGPALYSSAGFGTQSVNGEWPQSFAPFLLSFLTTHLSHGDGRPFYVMGGGVPNGASYWPVALSPVAPTVTDIPSGSITTTTAHLTPIPGPPGNDYPLSIFYKFTAPAAGAYRVSCSGYNPGGDVGFQADLAVSLTTPLCTDVDDVRIPHTLYTAEALGLSNTPTPGADSIVGTAPTGAWAGWAGYVAIWGPTDSGAVPASAGWRFRRPEVGDRYGQWLWDGSVWQDGSTGYGPSTTITVTAGQTVYVRVSGCNAERTLNQAPIGVTVAWVAV